MIRTIRPNSTDITKKGECSGVWFLNQAADHGEGIVITPVLQLLDLQGGDEVELSEVFRVIAEEDLVHGGHVVKTVVCFSGQLLEFAFCQELDPFLIARLFQLLNDRLGKFRHFLPDLLHIDELLDGKLLDLFVKLGLFFTHHLIGLGDHRVQNLVEGGSQRIFLYV
jgi:hypothetical protein